MPLRTHFFEVFELLPQNDRHSCFRNLCLTIRDASMVVLVVSLASPMLVTRFQCVKSAGSLDLVRGKSAITSSVPTHVHAATNAR